MGPPEEPESKFIARLVARDERAFSELVSSYERRMYVLCHRMLGRDEEAREASQEIFLLIFKALGTFRGEAKLSTWVYRIAVNHCNNRSKYLRRRHEGKTEDVSELDGNMTLDAPGFARPDEALQGSRVEEVVRRALLEIDEAFRECLILRDIEDMSYEQIGAITGLPEGTVKSRIFRARKELRALVEARLGERIE